MTSYLCLVELSQSLVLFSTRYAATFYHYCVLIFHQIVSDIYDRFSHLLQSLNLVWLDCEVFAAAIEAKGAPLHQCWGFIDGTVRPIARPVRNQRIMYSGHKRIHCLKFQVNYNVNNNNNYFIMFYSQWKRPMV